MRSSNCLPSGDTIDVLFRNGLDWIAVEVKSSLSNSLDITRGLFQCVKYRAVIEAVQATRNLEQNARAILGAGLRQYHLKNVDFDKWVPIDFIPEHLVDDGHLRPNAVSVAIAIIEGVDGVDNAPSPSLDQWIESEEVVPGAV